MSAHVVSVAKPGVRAVGLTAALMGFGLHAGCAASDRTPGPAIEIRGDGVVVVRNALEGGETWRASEIARIGVLDGDAAYTFAAIRDVELGADGRVYVLDSQARQVRVFGPDGRHLATAGRTGTGPGEFQSPTGMLWAPDGNLWVQDSRNRRYTVLSPDGELVAEYRATLRDFSPLWRGTFDPQGRLWEPTYVFDPVKLLFQAFLVRHEVRGDQLVALDTVALPEFHPRMLELVVPGGRAAYEVPYSPQLHWVFDGRAGLWAGISDRYRLWHQSLEGDTLRIVELPRASAPVTDADRQRERDGYENMLRGMGGQVDQLDFSLIPATKPVFGAFILDDEEQLWVPHWSETASRSGVATGEHLFDVFDAGGRFLAQLPVTVLPNPSPAIRGGLIAGVVRDELDVQRVVVYRLSGPR